jgi:hypothetical protein
MFLKKLLFKVQEGLIKMRFLGLIWESSTSTAPPFSAEKRAYRKEPEPKPKMSSAKWGLSFVALG